MTCIKYNWIKFYSFIIYNMSLIIHNNSLWVEIETNVKIWNYNVNRTGFFENGQPKFSVNLYLDYYNTLWSIYEKKNISLDNLQKSELNFDDFYIKMKELEEFKDWVDNIPVYVDPVVENEIMPEVIEKIK